MDPTLRARLRKYVNLDQPIGPSDAEVLLYGENDRALAAALFDPHNTSFNNLLNRTLSVIIGRRGSGKTALLHSYLYKSFIPRPRRTAEEFDLDDYQIIIRVETYKHLSELQKLVRSRAVSPLLVEAVVDGWHEVVGSCILEKLCQAEMSAETDALRQIQSYIVNDDDIRTVRALVHGPKLLEMLPFVRKPGHPLPRDVGEALALAEEHLAERNRRAVVLFDSLDQWPIDTQDDNQVICGLARYADTFNTHHSRMKLKVCIPAEIYPELRRASSNPLKDFVHVDRIKWTSHELARIAAHRYKIFLELHDINSFNRVCDIDFGYRTGVRQFWEEIFAENCTNKYGAKEHPMTYILRHTQLVPRQALMILDLAIKKSMLSHGTVGILYADSIRDATEEIETRIAAEVFSGFSGAFEHAERLVRALFGNSETVFSHDELEDRWRKWGRKITKERAIAEFDFADLTDMLLRMGIIGTVTRETPRYYETQFAYDVLEPWNVGPGQRLGLHPIFSTFARAAGNAGMKPVLPQGTFWPEDGCE